MSEEKHVVDVMTKEGKQFSLKAQCVGAIKRQGLEETHIPWLTKEQGWIGIPKDDSRGEVDNTPPKRVPSERYSVRVYRANTDEENRDLVIKVTANGPTERSIFKPGTEVMLTIAQLNILRDAKISSSITIDANSGIYEAKSPEQAAKNMYPDFQVTTDRATGLITMVKNLPQYIIEFTGSRPEGF